MEILDSIAAAAEYDRRAKKAATEVAEVGKLTVRQGNPGDDAVNDWIADMMSIYRMITGKEPATSVGSPDRPNEGIRPEIPLHTNASENNIRCQVTKRKVSGGTRSNIGRDCRDAFLGLNKNCAKLGIAFWDYLGSRLAVPSQPEVPYLPAIVRHRCATA
jgi:hypothetical protein